MAHFDLSSVYASGSQYSVLSLLKKFVDIIDSSDFSTTAETATAIANLKTEVEAELLAVQSGLESSISGVAGDLSSEVTRATTKEGQLQSDIDDVSQIVTLVGSSGTLNDLGYSRIQKEHTLIRLERYNYSPVYYRYDSESSTSIIYRPLTTWSASSNGESVYFYDTLITITKATKGWAYQSTNSSSTSTYNSSKINTLLSGKQNTLTFDNTPTENSTNPVKSGGVYSALQQLKNGTLPVYEVEDDTDMDTLVSEISVPCILTCEGNDDFYLVNYLSKEDRVILFIFSFIDSSSSNLQGNIEWIEGAKWSEVNNTNTNLCGETPIQNYEYAIKSYVDSNKGTKLYLHNISISHSQGGESVLLILTESEKIKLTDLQPVYMGGIQSLVMKPNFATKLSLTANSQNIYISKCYIDPTDNIVKIQIDDSIVVANVTNFVDTVTPL